MSHTPGPWSSIDCRILPCSYFLTGAPIATVHLRKKQGMQMANATLIAAAPELLEALIRCEKRLVGNRHTPQFQADYDMVIAAITKATGAAS
jgi:hypothetical protein